MLIPQCIMFYMPGGVVVLIPQCIMFYMSGGSARLVDTSMYVLYVRRWCDVDTSMYNVLYVRR